MKSKLNDMAMEHNTDEAFALPYSRERLYGECSEIRAPANRMS